MADILEFKYETKEAFFEGRNVIAIKGNAKVRYKEKVLPFRFIGWAENKEFVKKAVESLKEHFEEGILLDSIPFGYIDGVMYYVYFENPEKIRKPRRLNH